jgi:hypothetical protein
LLDKDYKNIKRIEASIGGYFGTSYTFKVEFDRGEVIWEASGDDFEPALMIQMDIEGMNTFIEAIRKCRVLSWKRKYVDLNVLDGTQWVLEIQYNDILIKKSGSNDYPEEWDGFCEVIQKLTGKPFH